VLDIMSPLEFVTKGDEEDGYATVQDALQTLPVNFGAGRADFARSETSRGLPPICGG
jgi:hypothetical protein